MFLTALLTVVKRWKQFPCSSAVGWIKSIGVKTSASYCSMVVSHIHSIERRKPDRKEYKRHEAQKQAEINSGVKSQDRVAIREVGRGTKVFPESSNVFLGLGGDT